MKKTSPEEFLAFAAGVLGVASLTMDDACGELALWDSVMHLKLVMETEAAYGISIPIERIAGLKTARDFYALLP